MADLVVGCRVRVQWDTEGLEQYKTLLSSSLPLLQASLSNPPSQSLASILLDCTKFALNSAAKVSFKTVKLSKQPIAKVVTIDPDVKKAQTSAL